MIKAKRRETSNLLIGIMTALIALDVILQIMR